MRLRILLIGLCLLNVAADSVRFPPRHVIARTRPVLVFLVGQSDDLRRRERRFVGELGLALDGIPVQTVTPATGFLLQPLPRQIASVRQALRRRKSVAVTWISRLDARSLLLHMVVLSTGRALVRLIEARVGADTEARLALAARELLGTAYLFEAKPKVTEPTRSAITKVVNRVRVQIGASPPARAKKWGVIGGVLLYGGIAKAEGPALWQGGQLSLQRNFVQGLWGRVGLGAAAGPFGSVSSGEVSGWELWPTAGLAYLWRTGRFMLGVSLEAQLRSTHLNLRAGDGPEQQVSIVRFRGHAAAELQWPADSTVGLVLKAGLGLMSHHDAFARASTSERFFALPVVDWEAQLGPRFAF